MGDVRRGRSLLNTRYFPSWMTELLTSYPKFFLGGFSPVDDGEESYLAMFGRFWDRYRAEQPQHPIFEKSIDHQRATIPFALHGEKGRSLAKVPLMALAFQVIIPFSGENKLNSETFPSFASVHILYMFSSCSVKVSKASHKFAPKRLA